MGQQKEREKMNMLIKILKNIGVIVLAIALFVFVSIPGNLLVSVFTNEYLQLIIPSIVSILVTFGLVWFVSGKLLKIDCNRCCFTGFDSSVLCVCFAGEALCFR